MVRDCCCILDLRNHLLQVWNTERFINYNGEVVKVETEFPSALDIKLNWDNRTYCKKYRCYVRYVCDGQEYVARSFRAYVRAIYFPGDIVQIKVSDKDKQLVDLIKIVGRRRT